LLEGHNAVGERVEIGHDVGRRHGPLRSGVDVHHPRAPTQRDDLRNPRRLLAREDIHREPETTEMSRDLAHVDVHPARLLASQRGQRTGVNGDDADALHAVSPAAARGRPRTPSNVIDAAHERRGAAPPRTTLWKCSIIARYGSTPPATISSICPSRRRSAIVESPGPGV